MIRITIKPSTILKRGKGAFISLYPESAEEHEEMLERIETVGNVFDEKPLDYEFQVSVKFLEDVLLALDKWDIELCGDVPKKIVEAVEKKNSVIEQMATASTEFQFKTKPFDHQLESFEYAKEHDSFLLGDEQGLGKTKQAIDIAVSRKSGFKHCLIISCISGLRWNWHDEVLTHSHEKAHILGARINTKGNVVIDGLQARIDDLLKPHDEYFLITNIESLRDKNFAACLEQLTSSGEIGMAIVDEVHKCKNSTSSQGEALHKVKSYYKMALTGTPLMNNPIDIYNIMKWLGYDSHSLTAFKQHYCLLDGFKNIVGYKNLSELRERVQAFMLRRLKDEVLDLPPKIRKVEYIEMNTAQTKIYKEAVTKLKKDIDKVRLSKNPLAEFIRLRQATGYPEILTTKKVKSSKFERAFEIIDEIVENGGKVLVFSNWTKVIEPFYEQVPHLATSITGELDDDQKQENKKFFMENPSCKVLCGTIGAMGTGFTLTAAQTIIFLDEPWTGAEKDQAEDRAHRIGTKGTVTVYTLLCKNTIDEQVHRIVLNKGEMAKMLIDGKVSKGKEGDFIDFLLN